MPSYLLVSLAFSAGFLLVMAANFVLVDLSETRRKKLRLRSEQEYRLRQQERARSMVQDTDFSEAAEDFKQLQARTTFRERLVAMVDQSGTDISARKLTGYAILGGMAAGLLTLLIFRNGYLGLFAVALGGLVPVLYVVAIRARRLRKLQGQLPDAFDLMSRTLRAGQTTSQALQSVADEFSAPVCEEFGICYDQQNLGMSPELAMRGLAKRTGLLEIKIFVLAVMVHRQTGGNMAELLEKLATVIRQRQRIHGMIKSLTAEGRFQAMILLALPPFMLVVMYSVNRAYVMTLFDYPALLVGMFASMTIGALWMMKIVNFDF